MNNFLRYTFNFFVYAFAFAGFVLIAGFFAIKYHWTDTLGRVDFNDRYFTQAAKAMEKIKTDGDLGQLSLYNQCKAKVLGQIYPTNSNQILSAYEQTKSDELLANMMFAAEMNLGGNLPYQESLKKCDSFKNGNGSEVVMGTSTPSNNLYRWINTTEWQTLKSALVKDQAVIAKAGEDVGVPPRQIVMLVIGEQLRLFNSDREVFKQFFQPLKILGNEVQFSWGVAGFKEETAKQVEQNLKNPSSDFYLGPDHEHLLDFKTNNPNAERFGRLTDDKDHYYSYLYAALFLKEIEQQWQKAGHDISGRPEVLATLFNLGFNKSNPNEDPQVGGADIDINGTKYTFGSLAYQFYYSGELLDEFPYGIEKQ